MDIGSSSCRGLWKSDAVDFTAADVRLMQGLAARVFGVRPELANNDATVGELAWVWGKDHAALGNGWRRRLWFAAGGEVAAWGWTHLPYQVTRTDGSVITVPHAYLAWQLDPARPELLDEILAWFESLSEGTDRKVSVRAADEDALARLAAHGYVPDERMLADDGYWVQLNWRDLSDIAVPALPDGFRFRTAMEAGPEAAVAAHVAAWHPSTFGIRGYEGVRETWPYRGDLHVLIEAPDGTMAATTIMWFDETNLTAEFEPVGTHQGYRRLGLGQALLLHGMRTVRDAGAKRMIVTCLGAAGHTAARGLYYSVGFEPFTREVPHIKRT
jgi:GNAT superfamily N-acetyltransferase